MPGVLKALRHRISCLEQQMGIPEMDQSFKLKSRPKACIKGIMTEQGVTRNAHEINNEIKKFWGPLLGNQRDYEPSILKDMLYQQAIMEFKLFEIFLFSRLSIQY